MMSGSQLKSVYLELNTFLNQSNFYHGLYLMRNNSELLVLGLMISELF